MSLQAPIGSLADLVESHDPMPVVASEIAWHGLVFDVRRDRVDLGDAGVVTRDYLDHPGAVVVLPWREVTGVDGSTEAQVLLVRQYRHAVGSWLWELPAGLLDIAGEPPWQAAARELHEEADLRAATWHVLVDDVASPGILPEWVRVFLARDLHDVPEQQRHARDGEEASLRPLWLPFDDVLTAALTGRIHNAATVAGLLAAAAHRQRDWRDLRPHDAPWPEHPAYRES
ncbi:MAG TPA: NUDIX hydrolase [Dermatophilaceae bacterium]|nr:NUDIX hydrolase [Dermatophilaceae bacterium]